MEIIALTPGIPVRHQLFQPAPVFFIEIVEQGTIRVQDADYFSLVKNRNDDLRPGQAATGNVPGESLHIGYDQGPALFPTGAAHTPAFADPRTGHRSPQRTN